MIRRLTLLLAFFICPLVLFSAEPLPQEVVDVGVEERLGQSIDGSLRFITSTGKTVPLSSLFNQDKPIVLNFIYYNCPMLCSLVLDGVYQSMSQAEPKIGQDYRALVISFEPKDTPERSAAYQERYVSQLGLPASSQAWQFWTGSQASIREVTHQAGFKYKYLEKENDYAHAAVTIVLTPDGKISRYLYGVSTSPFDFKMALIEAKKGNTSSSLERALLFCYQYDPDKRGYVLQAWKIMRGAGILTFLVLLLFLVHQRRSERFRK